MYLQTMKYAKCISLFSSQYVIHNFFVFNLFQSRVSVQFEEKFIIRNLRNLVAVCISLPTKILLQNSEIWLGQLKSNARRIHILDLFIKSNNEHGWVELSTYLRSLSSNTL